MNHDDTKTQSFWILDEEGQDTILNIYSFITEWGGEIIDAVQDAIDGQKEQTDQYKEGRSDFLEALGQIKDECKTISGITMAIADFSDQISWENGYLMQRADLICELLKAVARSGGGGGGGSSMLSSGLAAAALALAALAVFPEGAIPTITTTIVGGTAAAGFSAGAILDFVVGLFGPKADKEIEEAEERAEGSTPAVPYSGAYAKDDQFFRVMEPRPAEDAPPDSPDVTIGESAHDYHDSPDITIGESSYVYHDNPGPGSSQEQTVMDSVQGTRAVSTASMPVGSFLSSPRYQENLLRTAGYRSEFNEMTTKQEILLKLETESAPRGVVQPIINMHGLEIHKEVDAQEVMDRIAQCLIDAMESQPALPSRPAGKVYRL